ncbi:unnamed protein product [Caenorhabditis bovis]|uniref:R3H-associated N-terminal domain-containing protein n=1 Tax=Caenorhabditis bovis TaxID=2654633 RepID=A0A8S1EWB7_9PELO|nr:unnamed protein product [Caenorhabditis bovis]
MGVFRNDKGELKPERVEEELNYIEIESSEVESNVSRSTSIEQLNNLQSRRAMRAQKNSKKSRNFFDEVDTDGVNVKRNMGYRKWRRVENARILLTYTDLEDICEDYSDICPKSYTPFDRLFENKENMKIWNEFVEKDEEDQENILKAVDGVIDMCEQQGPSDWCLLGEKLPKISNTPKKGHHIYSGKACFDRIDNRNKRILLGKKVNWALVDHLEEELRELFMDDVLGQNHDGEIVYVTNFPLASDRLIAHIVAQYLWLNSQSLTLANTGERITEIRNARDFFIPPDSTLINYLESDVFKKKIDFVPFSMRSTEGRIF